MLGINNSINGANSISYAQSLAEKSMNRLSSAKRINSAADDAAGLAIVSGMVSQMGGTQVAERNSNDGISAVQTADGSLKNISESLQRMRELAVQSQNGTLNASDRQALNQEFAQLSQANNQTAQQSTFNGQKLLAGGYSLNIQTGANAGNTTNVALGDSTSNGLGLNGLDVTTAANAGNALNAIDAALSKIGQQQSVLGASQSALESNISNLQTNYENTAAAASRIQDTNYAEETSNLSKANILDKAAMYTQVQQQKTQRNMLSLFA